VTQPEAIVNAIGQPATVRIGVVESVGPLVVNVQGASFTELGVIGTCPSVGDTVALLGQSSVGSRAASWLVLGVIEQC
jgi:hypothetical protein